ncbi:MAG: polysaccharide biosynthesis/export family protein, partial [Rhizobacter sp.]|nr:polysaccharide biosynthesis/export family protein [Rhizobacter sp.]
MMQLRAVRSALAIVAFGAALAGSPVFAAQVGGGSAPPAAAAAEYRLGAGDLVRVTVYQNPDLSLETRIGEAGNTSFPLLGSVKIGGLVVSAAERLIADGLRNGGFVKQPQVSVLVLQVRGNQVSVLGQVNR